MLDKNLDITLDVLAASVEEVASICDLETALLLVEHFGGCRIWIPQNWHENHELNVIGEDHAKLLMERLGGSAFEIPRRAFSSYGLYIMIKRLQESGKTQKEIALSLGVAMKTIRDINKKNGLRNASKNGKSSFNKDPNQIDIEDYIKSA